MQTSSHESGASFAARPPLSSLQLEMKSRLLTTSSQRLDQPLSGIEGPPRSCKCSGRELWLQATYHGFLRRELLRLLVRSTNTSIAKARSARKSFQTAEHN